MVKDKWEQKQRIRRPTGVNRWSLRFVRDFWRIGSIMFRERMDSEAELPVFSPEIYH